MIGGYRVVTPEHVRRPISDQFRSNGGQQLPLPARALLLAINCSRHGLGPYSVDHLLDIATGLRFIHTGRGAVRCGIARYCNATWRIRLRRRTVPHGAANVAVYERNGQEYRTFWLFGSAHNPSRLPIL